MIIELQVDRLVLDGLSLEDGGAAALRSAMESELTQLLVEHGIGDALRGGGSFASIRTPAMPAAADTGPSELGAGIARSVSGGLGR